MPGKIHVGDIGTVIEYTILDDYGAVVNLASATGLKIKLRSPNRSILNKTAVHSTNGTDGKMRYVTQAGDISTHGDWLVQGWVELPEGSWYTDISMFTVESNL